MLLESAKTGALNDLIIINCDNSKAGTSHHLHSLLASKGIPIIDMQPGLNLSQIIDNYQDKKILIDGIQEEHSIEALKQLKSKHAINFPFFL